MPPRAPTPAPSPALPPSTGAPPPPGARFFATPSRLCTNPGERRPVAVLLLDRLLAGPRVFALFPAGRQQASTPLSPSTPVRPPGLSSSLCPRTRPRPSRPGPRPSSSPASSCCVRSAPLLPSPVLALPTPAWRPARSAALPRAPGHTPARAAPSTRARVACSGSPRGIRTHYGP
nr:translation initiation factor IF-2-like [Aegilops tauschii subsp. strangulata]